MKCLGAIFRHTKGLRGQTVHTCVCRWIVIVRTIFRVNKLSVSQTRRNFVHACVSLAAWFPHLVRLRVYRHLGQLVVELHVLLAHTAAALHSLHPAAAGKAYRTHKIDEIRNTIKTERHMHGMGQASSLRRTLTGGVVVFCVSRKSQVVATCAFTLPRTAHDK